MDRYLADAVLVLHAAFVLFVVASLPAILVGGARGWGWVRGRCFRFGHLAAIGVVVAQAWADVVCPLTTLEAWLREQAGEAGHAGGFVEHWLGRLLFYQAPAWVFVTVYTLFGGAVLAAWVLYPPRAGRDRRASATRGEGGPR